MEPRVQSVRPMGGGWRCELDAGRVLATVEFQADLPGEPRATGASFRLAQPGRGGREALELVSLGEWVKAARAALPRSARGLISPSEAQLQPFLEDRRGRGRARSETDFAALAFSYVTHPAPHTFVRDLVRRFPNGPSAQTWRNLLAKAKQYVLEESRESGTGDARKVLYLTEEGMALLYGPSWGRLLEREQGADAAHDELRALVRRHEAPMTPLERSVAASERARWRRLGRDPEAMITEARARLIALN